MSTVGMAMLAAAACGTGNLVPYYSDTSMSSNYVNELAFKADFDFPEPELHYDPRPARRVGRTSRGHARARYGHAGRVYSR